MGGLSANFSFQYFGHLSNFNTVCGTYILHKYLCVVHGIDHQSLNVSYVEGRLQVQPNMLGKKCTVRRKQFQIESYCHHEIELPAWVGSIIASLKYNYLVEALGRLCYIHSYFIFNFKSSTIQCEWQTTERGKCKSAANRNTDQYITWYLQ